MMFSRPLLLTLATAALLSLPVAAQDLRVHPTPFSVWLDFGVLRTTKTLKAGLPIWMDSVKSSLTKATAENPEKSVIRLNLRRMGNLNSEIGLRLFFEDLEGAAPTITGWTETGSQLYSSRPLGMGINLPTSESLTIGVADLDYLEITVPGDGRSLRGAFLCTLGKHEGRHALDFEPPSVLQDPFSNGPSAAPGKDDSYLFGRVKATIEPGSVRLTPEAPGSIFEFELQTAPLLAVISFEVLNVDPIYPPELTLNQRPLGRPSLILPDLADPGFQGRVRALEADMHFEYTGWIRCQQIVPGSALQAGINVLALALGRQSGAIAIRSIEMELKYPSPTLDYHLIP